ncbi:MAG: caspase family protein [Halothiobacillaceae bacterium]
MTLGLSPLSSSFAQPAPAHRQRALLIGNAAYRHVPRLINPGHDATLMAAALRRLGVQCTCLTDCTNVEMSRAVEGFIRSLRQSPVDLVWFYFSGHGAYLNGRNVMLGVDTVVRSPQALLAQGFDLDALQGMLKQVGPGATILVEDACRNNPFLQMGESATRGIQANVGLMPRQDWGGAIIAYSTAPFTEALDWPHRPNGPYASALVRVLSRGGQHPIEAVFRSAADIVWNSTGRRQQPGYYSNLREDVWLQGNALSLRMEPRPGVTRDDPADGGRGVPPVHYQAGLAVEASTGTPLEWERALDGLTADAERISISAAEMDQMISRAGERGATLRDQTLGAMLLEVRWPEKAPLDKAEAMLLRVARQGYGPGQVLLGELAFRRGKYALAYTWLNQAARSGSARAVMDINNMLIDDASRSAQLAPYPTPEQFRQFDAFQSQMMRNLSGLLPPQR